LNKNTAQSTQCLINDEVGQEKLVALLTMCFDTLDTYGKTEKQFENSLAGFLRLLSKYSFNAIENAIYKYLEHATVMPKPSDLIKIINPPKPKRAFCKVTFLDIKRRKRENQFVSLEEEKYCQEFIEAALTCDESQRDLIQSTIKQMEIENKRYWLNDCL
jgi:hypothetical protein